MFAFVQVSRFLSSSIKLNFVRFFQCSVENELIKKKMSKRKASLTSPGRQVTFVLDQEKPDPAEWSQNLLTHDKIDWAKCFICEKEKTSRKNFSVLWIQ